ncbi:MAG: thiamine pyrophosphate-binding protein [Candidatus Levybacteria bacterium]|nr:thiamine pyrophosphate-binding protein [Candidatus Levybacteria bacterium]
MNGAEYLCKILENKGVKYIFGLFGDIQTDFAHAVRKSSLKWIGVHNEKSGGFMADIYARVSKTPGVIFSTLGPGGTNLTSALANATQDRSPLIAISDQVPLKDFHIESHQYIDFEKAFAPQTGITKHTAVVRKIADLPQIFDNAFKIANTEPKGAVHISIPADILGMKCDKIKYKSSASSNVVSYPKSTLSYLRLLKKISINGQALVIAGGSIERSEAEREFKSFIERFNLPVLTTFRGKNALPSKHPQNLGTISRHLADVMDDVINAVSNIITLGYDYNEGVKPSLWKGKEKHVINIDNHDNRIKGIFYPPSLFGNIQNILSKLNTENAPTHSNEFKFDKVRNIFTTAVDKALDVEHPYLHPKRIIEAVNKLYGDNSVIICDVGLNKYYSGLLLESTEKNKILFSNGQSAMAFSSGALGAKLADPQKDVIVLVGDGGFLMNPQEVITAVQNKQAITWVIFNNGGLGLVEQAQKKQAPDTHGVIFSKVLFSKLAQSFGVYGKHIGQNDDIYSILAKVKKIKKSAIIDVLVEYTPRRKSYQKHV